MMNDQYSQMIRKRILSLCESRGFTIYQLSQMSGVSYSTIDSIVNGISFNPTIKTLHKIATAFNMTVADFLDFEELNNFSFDDWENEK